jgi:hypothetical protein
MGKLLGMFGAVMVYFCIASVITLAVLLVYAKTKGFLDPDRVATMMAVARGETLPHTAANSLHVGKEAPKSATYEELEQFRQLRERNLELREQALRNQRDLLAGERLKLQSAIEQFADDKQEYAKNLIENQDKAIKQGRDNIRQLWETVKPKLAKELILNMIDKGELREVAAIMRDMTIPKQAKIVAEFKSDPEQAKLDDLLRLLRVPNELAKQDSGLQPVPETANP